MQHHHTSLDLILEPKLTSANQCDGLRLLARIETLARASPRWFFPYFTCWRSIELTTQFSWLEPCQFSLDVGTTSGEQSRLRVTFLGRWLLKYGARARSACSFSPKLVQLIVRLAIMWNHSACYSDAGARIRPHTDRNAQMQRVPLGPLHPDQPPCW